MGNATKILSMLGGEKRREFRETLADMQKHRVTSYVGVWCEQSGYAVLCVVANGEPIRWYLAGAMDRDDARAWLGAHESVFKRPAKRPALALVPSADYNGTRDRPAAAAGLTAATESPAPLTADSSVAAASGVNSRPAEGVPA